MYKQPSWNFFFTLNYEHNDLREKTVSSLFSFLKKWFYLFTEFKNLPSIGKAYLFVLFFHHVC